MGVGGRGGGGVKCAHSSSNVGQSLSSSRVSIQKEDDCVKEERAITDVGDVDLDIGGCRDACCDGVHKRLLDVISEGCYG